MKRFVYLLIAVCLASGLVLCGHDAAPVGPTAPAGTPTDGPEIAVAPLPPITMTATPAEHVKSIEAQQVQIMQTIDQLQGQIKGLEAMFLKLQGAKEYILAVHPDVVEKLSEQVAPPQNDTEENKGGERTPDEKSE